MVTAVIIDSEKQIRDKITSHLSSQGNVKVLACGKDAYDALKLAGNLKPDIVLLDNNLEYIEGGEIPPLLRIRSTLSAVVILTSLISDYQLRKAAYNEVAGFVHKEKDMDTLHMILELISRGGCYISPHIAIRVLRLISGKELRPVKAPARTHVLRNKDEINYSLTRNETMPDRDPTGFLSKMELRILTYIGRGYTSSEIAENSGLAVGTVRNYISSVMHKTGLRNRSQLARYAYYNGLVPADV